MAQGLGDFLKKLGIERVNKTENRTKNLLENPGGALE